MGREVRRVPSHWQHPVQDGKFKPLRQLEMPHWRNGEATHYQMYETTTEGTPISPAMESPEELAHWLVDNQVSAFGDQTASFEAWLMVAQGRTAISCMVTKAGVINGVEANYRIQKEVQDVFSAIDKKALCSTKQGLGRD